MRAHNNQPKPAPRPKTFDLAGEYELAPCRDFLIVEDEGFANETAGGIIIPDGSIKSLGERPSWRVVAVGPGFYQNGQLIPIPIAVGDLVILSQDLGPTAPLAVLNGRAKRVLVSYACVTCIATPKAPDAADATDATDAAASA